MAKSINCPQCGAPIEVTNPYSKIIVCQYCDTHSQMESGNAAVLGKFPKLADLPTYLFLGAEGTIKDKRFKAVGRMRYQHSSGYWDEWFLTLEDADQGWLTEDEGELSLYKAKKIKSALPDIDEIQVGKKITINDMSVSVLEKGEAVVAGAQGELNFYVAPGSKMRYIEGVADGKLVSLEITDNEIELFVGKELERKHIKIENRT